MSGQESPTPTTSVSQAQEVPGAFPDTAECPEDAQVSSDLTSLSRAVRARRAEYTRRKELRVRVGSWNVAALSGTEEDVGRWFVGKPASGVPLKNENGHVDVNKEDTKDIKDDGFEDAGPAAESSSEDSIDVYVLGLQEIVDVSSPSEALRPYVDPAPSNKWKEAVQKALPPGYELVSSQQLMGLLLLVYAAPSIAPSISSVSSSSIGTGLMGYMGNKGAVATRIVIGGATRVVFLNCHMAAGADKASFDRRIWDAAQIVARTKFDPLEEEDDISEEPSVSLGQEDFAFWLGDLNCRLDDIPGDDVRRLLHLHAENAFRLTPKEVKRDKENMRPSLSHDESDGLFSIDSETSANGYISMEDNDIEPLSDPTSLETTLASLLPHDQLICLQKKQKAFHEGWREGPINFLPTYKYDVGRVGLFDSSEKQRSPSWCDRILFRTRHDYTEYLRRIKEAEEAKKRDEEMRGLGLDKEAEDDSVLFDYDPESDGAQDPGEYDENEESANAIGNVALTRDTPEDAIDMITYRSHQDIVSSDHKPLHADYVLTYDAVDPQLKAKIHQEVVRELDRAENEARPDITLVVERPFRKSAEEKPPNGVNDPDAVDFGQMRYDVPVARGLTLANTGGVTATFSFRYRPSESGDETDGLSPSWLNVRVDWPPDREDPGKNVPKEYTLPPGESVQVQLSLCVSDMDFVRDLNRGKADIEDILVLRVSNGRDHFISIRGQWLPTCFGFSLSELTRIPEGGIRQLDIKSQLSELDKDGENGARTSAPRELFRLTEAITELTERSVAEWGMVGEDSETEVCPWMSERTGWPFDPETWAHPRNHDRYKLLSSIREAIDTDASLTTLLPPELPARHRVELLSETLISFLQSLDDGLITQRIWDQLEQQILSSEKSKRILTADQSQSWVLETLSSSPAHSVSFTFLTFMLNRVANETAPVPPPPASSPPMPPVHSISRRSTSLSTSSLPPSESTTTTPSSTTPPTASPTASALPFPFRFKSRSRGLSGNGSSESDSVPITSAPNPTLKRRQAVNKSFAKIFAEAVFSSKIAPPEKDKERRAWEERKRSVLEPFLNADGL